MPRRRRRRSLVLRRNGGFALLVVLWTLVLIAFIVAHLTASGRTEMRIAGNLVNNAAAEAAADGAIAAAIFNQLEANPDQRWPLTREAHELIIGNSRVKVQLEDEAGRINQAVLEAVRQKKTTADIGGSLGTRESAEWIAKKVISS